jgi:iron complex outermembrane receptor protein
MSTPPLIRFAFVGAHRALLTLASICCLLAVPSAHAQTVEPKYSFDVPAGEAKPMLRQFAAQAKREIVIAVEAVDGVRTKAVKGEMTARAAVDQMLADTGLVATQDTKTGAFAVRKETPVESKNVPSRRAPVTTARDDDGVLELEGYQVSGKRVSGAINQGVIPREENQAIPYDIISRADIERLGVSSIEDVFRSLTQSGDYGTGLQDASLGTTRAFNLGYTKSNVSLRGFSALQTAILVNGRRLMRTQVIEGPDISRIPLGAIERIEILSSSGSALYGGGAIGGVINIITRKNYMGSELTLYTGIAANGGAEEVRFTYTQGISAGSGRTTGTVTVDLGRRAPLRMQQRGYLDRVLARWTPGSPSFNGVPAYEQIVIPAFADLPGTVVVNSSVLTLGIPGSTGARFAAIPSGQNGTGLTPASFSATAGTTNIGSKYGRALLLPAQESIAVNAQIEHSLIPKRLEIYGELGVSYQQADNTAPGAQAAVSLSATDARNPFRTGVTPGFVGVPIRIFLDPYDLGQTEEILERLGVRSVLGIKGSLPGTWSYSLDVSGDYTWRKQEFGRPTRYFSNLMASSNAGARASYNLFADGNMFPTSAQNRADYYEGGIRSPVQNARVLATNVQFAGDIYDLPAGTARLSLGGEIIWSEMKERTRAIVPPMVATVLNLRPDSVSNFLDFSRRTMAVYTEGIVPVVGRKWHPLGLHSLDLNLGARYERVSDAGDALTTVIGAKVGVTEAVAFRFSRSEGFAPANESDLNTPGTFPGNSATVIDPLRGNTVQTYNFTVLGEGNPDLRPEKTVAYNAGMMFTPPSWKNTTFSVDYFYITKSDSVYTPRAQDVIALPGAYPGRVTRDAPSAQDVAQGWAGPVNHLDLRQVNIGQGWTDGFDISGQWQQPMEGIGKVSVSATGTFTNSWREKIAPGIATINYAGAAYNTVPIKWRGRLALGLERERFSARVTAKYTDDYSTSSTTPTAAYPFAVPFDGSRIPSTVTFDLQVGYRVPLMQAGAARWQRLLSGMQWTLGCLNVLDKNPPYVTDLTSFYSRYEDPRQRFIYLNVKKTF